MADPRVTVGIPTYNRSGSLREALNSVLDQSLTDIEVFVLDNASTDDTSEMIACLQDSRVHYIRNETNVGIQKNISMAFRVGSAPFVTVLPDDDFMHPENLGRKVVMLEGEPDLDVVHSANDFIHVAPDGSPRVQAYFGGGKVDRIETGAEALRRLLTAIPPYWINFPTAMIRRSIIDDDVILDLADGRADDLGFALRLVRRANRVGYIAKPLVSSRVHPDAGNVKMGVNELDSGIYKATLRSLEARNKAAFAISSCFA